MMRAFAPTAIYYLLISITLFPPPAYPQEQKALTLADCYHLALQQSEAIAIQKELIAQTQAHFQQALSGILPRVSFSSSDKRQDGSGSSAFTLRSVPERKFVMSQPLFAGFKEFAAMSGSKAEGRQRTLEKARAQELLLGDVADAFYLLMEKRQDLQTLGSIQGVLLERIEDLNAREKLGRSRASETVSAQAKLRQIEADIEEVQSEEAVARELLEFLTGREPIGPIVDTHLLAFEIPSEETYLQKSASRSDVRAAEEALTVAEKQVSIAQAGFLPTVGLEGNYYLERAGAAKDVTWDAALKVDVPIFQGGQTAGAVGEASSQARQVKLKLSEVRRRAHQEIRESYTRATAARRRSTALERSAQAFEESYRLQADEYRLSLVSNLDVLSALREFQDARRDLIHAHYEAKRLYWQLLASIGETPS